MKYLIINGSNLNMLGVREPDIYGSASLYDLRRLILSWCEEHGAQADFYQSNHEGDLVDAIQCAYMRYDGIVINPAAYTHTSVAIPDAIKAVGVPTVEVHLSDIHAREEFRRHSYTSPVCIKTIAGKHFQGYIEALETLEQYIAANPKPALPSRKTILFFDSGDTLIDEGSEMRMEQGGVVRTAQMIPGAKEALWELKRRGHTIALVADGLEESFLRMFRMHGILPCFDAMSISELVGCEKPSAAMFQTAMDALGLTEADKARIVMIGNNVERDIAGANRFGIRSVLETWSPRYRMTPANAEETPTYTVRTLDELPDLIAALERE